MECSETPGPRRHTRDIPTYPASTLPVHCTGASIHDCVLACAGVEVEVGPGHLVTTSLQYSERIVYSKATLPVPGGKRAADPRPGELVEELYNTHQLLAGATRTSSRSQRKVRQRLCVHHRDSSL